MIVEMCEICHELAAILQGGVLRRAIPKGVSRDGGEPAQHLSNWVVLAQGLKHRTGHTGAEVEVGHGYLGD
jgi:hypothetical protein